MPLCKAQLYCQERRLSPSKTNNHNPPCKDQNVMETFKYMFMKKT